ncbi:conserved hypothetical protein [Burkholderia diffusa]|uniref:hypothetical protein n=1 Tax=Burkholderia diffusa TaxID=488732 RepID=UPI001CB41E25|nr:hypothetical protein [Burkholderia diffusa]CAG9260940.1 conserved hypothetical protein [Burkholderia diffusa]
MRLPTTILVCASLLAACNRPSHPNAEGGIQRDVLQGFQTTFYRVTDGSQSWYEVAISINSSKTLRMPVFFVDNGQIVRIDQAEARSILDKWVRHRAAEIAAFSSEDPQIGNNRPFLAIDRNSR